MAKTFVFTITTGRSGTMYLSNLLRENLANAQVYHERLGYLNLGVHTPDASDFTTFNSIGNSPKIQKFWQRKLNHDMQIAEDTYAETSHFLVKAGLMENLSILLDKPESKIHIIILKRDVKELIWSFHNRFDFFNSGFTWLFYLDYKYPNTLTSAEALKKIAPESVGSALWYIHEMYTRAEYYKLLFKDHPQVIFHEVELSDIVKKQGAKNLLQELNLPLQNKGLVIPPKANYTKRRFYDEATKQRLHALCDKVVIDHKGIAEEFINAGRSLAKP